jgi:regulator of RNase E activity RraA
MRAVPVMDVKGCADTGQRYVPVGCAGQPILPGKYVVTVTTP